MIGDFIAAWPLFSANARRFLLSATLAGFAYSGVYFLLANLFLVRLGYEESFIGVFIATGAASFALFSLPAGIAGRRWGPRACMLGGYVFLILGLVMLSLAAIVPAAWRSIWLLSCCALREFGNAFYIINANPFLMDVTGTPERRFVFAARGAVVPLAGFLGSLAGGILPAWAAAILDRADTDPVTFMLPLLVGGAILIPGWLALLRTTDSAASTTGEATDGSPLAAPDEPADAIAAPRPGVSDPMRSPAPTVRDLVGSQEEPVRSGTPAPGPGFPLAPILTMVGVGLLYIASMAVAMSFFNLYMDQVLAVETARIGTVLAMGQLFAAPAGLMLAPLSARFGYARTFALSALGVGLGALLMGISTSWVVASVGAVTITTLSAIAFPAITVYQQELVLPEWRPVMSGAYMMSVALSWSALASGGGYFIAAAGYRQLFLLGSVLTLAGVVLFWLHARGVGRWKLTDDG